MNVIWAISIVPNPSVIRRAIKRSIRDTPITISAFIMGMLVRPIYMVRQRCFIPWIAMDAAVPITVAAAAARKAITRVV